MVHCSVRLLLQTVELKRELEELKKSFNVDSVANALREVKEYAARSKDLNIDTLQMKLMHLDEIGRRTQHADRELFSIVLQRFLCHKSHAGIGFLVSSLLASSTEARLLEKEHKFLKLHGKDKKSEDNEKSKKQENEPRPDMQMLYWPNMYPPAFGFPRFGPPSPYVPFRPAVNVRRNGAARPRLQY